MEHKTMDVLESYKGLRQMPYTLPEGYFDGLSRNVAARILTRRSRSRVVIAVAASAAVVAAAALLIAKPFERPSENYDELFTYSEMIPVTDPDAIYYSQAVQSEPTEEDIVNYLIYTRVGEDDIAEVLDNK